MLAQIIFFADLVVCFFVAYYAGGLLVGSLPQVTA